MAEYKSLLDEDQDWDDGLALAEELVTEAVINNQYGLLTKKKKPFTAFVIRKKINLKRKGTHMESNQPKKAKRDSTINFNQNNDISSRQLQPVIQNELNDGNVAGPSGVVNCVFIDVEHVEELSFPQIFCGFARKLRIKLTYAQIVKSALR